DVERDARPRRDVDGVAVAFLIGTAAVGYAPDVVARSDHSLGEEESDGQLAVVAGRPHGDGERLARNADLERLFEDDVVEDGGLLHPAQDPPRFAAPDALHVSFTR